MGRFENMSTLVKSYTGLTKAGFQDVGGQTPFSQGTAVEHGYYPLSKKWEDPPSTAI